jgi:AraC-like DNA-binding protein
MDKNNGKKTQTNSFLDRIDIPGTEWIAAYGREFILVHNPAFVAEPMHPYNLNMAMGIFCEKGSVEGKVNMDNFTIAEGGFFIIPPGNILEEIAGSDDFTGTYIFMTEPFLRSLEVTDVFKNFQAIAQCPYIVFNEEGRDAMVHYLRMARRMLGVKKNPQRYEVARLLTKSFFLGMGYFIDNEREDFDMADGKAAIIQKFISFLKEDYLEYRDVEHYAARMNMTPKYMSTIVKNATGRSASKWIDDYVVLNAKAMLTSTRKNIKTICDEMGFSSLSFFGRYFKRVCGLSPREYRYSILRATVEGDEEMGDEE